MVMPCAVQNCGVACLTVKDNDHKPMIVERGVPMKGRIVGKTPANETDGPQRKKTRLDMEAKAAEVQPQDPLPSPQGPAGRVVPMVQLQSAYLGGGREGQASFAEKKEGGGGGGGVGLTQILTF